MYGNFEGKSEKGPVLLIIGLFLYGIRLALAITGTI